MLNQDIEGIASKVKSHTCYIVMSLLDRLLHLLVRGCDMRIINILERYDPAMMVKVVMSLL